VTEKALKNAVQRLLTSFLRCALTDHFTKRILSMFPLLYVCIQNPLFMADYVTHCYNSSNCGIALLALHAIFRLISGMSIVRTNFNFFGEKFRFLTKLSSLGENLYFWWKLRFLTKISIFDPNFIFFQFLIQISFFSISDPNFNFFNFWPKFFNLWPKFHFFSNFDPNFIFFSISDPNFIFFNFWPKFQFFQFFTPISNFL